MFTGSRRLCAAIVTVLLCTAVVPRAASGSEKQLATPRAVCGPGSHPETGRQGRVTQKDVDSGRAARGFTCNTKLVAHYGDSGGYKVFRSVDHGGHECAIFDTTLLFPLNARYPGSLPTG